MLRLPMSEGVVQPGPPCKQTSLFQGQKERMTLADSHLLEERIGLLFLLLLLVVVCSRARRRREIDKGGTAAPLLTLEADTQLARGTTTPGP